MHDGCPGRLPLLKLRPRCACLRRLVGRPLDGLPELGQARAARLAKVGTSLTSVLVHCWRCLSNGQLDLTDHSKKRPDLVLYAFDATSAPTLVDFIVTHPTAPCGGA